VGVRSPACARLPVQLHRGGGGRRGPVDRRRRPPGSRRGPAVRAVGYSTPCRGWFRGADSQPVGALPTGTRPCPPSSLREGLQEIRRSADNPPHARPSGVPAGPVRAPRPTPSAACGGGRRDAPRRPGPVPQRTLKSYESAVRRHLVPDIGRHRLDRLQPEHLDQLTRRGSTLATPPPRCSATTGTRPPDAGQLQEQRPADGRLPTRGRSPQPASIRLQRAGGRVGRRPIPKGRAALIRRPAAAGSLGRLWSGLVTLQDGSEKSADRAISRQSAHSPQSPQKVRNSANLDRRQPAALN
jgi:hypothetical protein